MPRNAEQTFALDALMNDQIPLVSLTGKAGTGKTLLAWPALSPGGVPTARSTSPGRWCR